jgi:hypothetical protein
MQYSTVVLFILFHGGLGLCRTQFDVCDTFFVEKK